jgi:hypothetical protein
VPWAAYLGTTGHWGGGGGAGAKASRKLGVVAPMLFSLSQGASPRALSGSQNMEGAGCRDRGSKRTWEESDATDNDTSNVHVEATTGEGVT